MHTCRDCGKSEPEVDFYRRVINGRSYPIHLCKRCKCRYRKKFHSPPGKVEEWAKKQSAKRREERKLGLNTARFILHDSRRSDRKKGFDNDLDHLFINELISAGCHYCGETGLKMTLDRVDNGQGHLKENVLPACIRCNYIRRDMPIKAWFVVAESIRKAREDGLFGKWTAEIVRKIDEDSHPSLQVVGD